MKLGIIDAAYLNQNPNSTTGTYEDQSVNRVGKNYFEQIYLIDPALVWFEVSEGQQRVFAADYDNKRINIFDEIDALYVKGTRAAKEMIMDILEAVHRLHPDICMFDPFESFIKPTSKISPVLRRLGRITQPDTIFTLSTQLKFRDLPVKFPVIVKPNAGLKGHYIKVCKNLDELVEHIETSQPKLDKAKTYGYGWLIQEKLEIVEEYRVMVVGNESLGCVRKTEIPGNPDVRNYYQGSEFEKVDNKDAEAIAIEASLVSRQSFSGVDLVLTADGQYYVLECNRNPNFTAFRIATGVPVADAICRYMLEETKKLRPESGAKPKLQPMKKKVTPRKKRIFIGSSGQKGKAVAEMVHLNLESEFETTIWYHNIFKAGSYNLESLLTALDNFDYAIMVLTPDDQVEKKGEQTFVPRDNVLFELGLFMARLGKENTFALVPQTDDLSLPTDLDGYVIITYQTDRQDGNLQAAVDSGCIRIKRAIKENS